MNRFRGTGVALVTPFNEDMSVDYEALGQLVDHVSQGGVDYLVVMGTTAEAPTLAPDEKIKVLEFVKSRNAKNLPIVFGMGGNNTRVLVEQYKNFEHEVDALLLVTPFYNRPNQTGLIRHYEAIADVSPKSILLYNVPKRTGTNLEADSVITLSQHDKIIGIKEATAGNFDQQDAIRTGVSEDFLVISGDDDLIIPFMQHGGHGVISVIANAMPAETSTLVKSALKGDFSQAEIDNEIIQPFIDLIFTEGSPTGIKSLLQARGIGNGLLRLPMVEASAQLEAKLLEAYKNLDIKKGVL